MCKAPIWGSRFQDEFEGNALDLKKWNANDPWGRECNRALQAYLMNAFEVKDGILRIKADKGEAFYNGKQRSYTSGVMTTYQKLAQQYEQFEIRYRTSMTNF
jgi:beta-glucanase (GH16 family)